MAITFINKGAFASGTTSASAAVPTNYHPGDLLIIMVHTPNNAVTTPSGWTLLAPSPVSTGTANTALGVRLTVFWKLATASESAVTISVTSGTCTCVQMTCWRGNNTTTPFDVTPTSKVDASSTTALSCPTITTVTAACMIINAIALDTDATSTANMGTSTNASLVSRTEGHDQTVTTGTGGGMGFIYGIKSTAGAVNATTATVTTGAHAYLTMALRPSDNPTISSYGTTTDGTKIQLTFNKAMNDPTGHQSVFTVLVAGVSRTVSSVALNANTSIIELTLASAVTYGQTVTVAHTYNAAYPIKSTDGGVLATFTAQTVANNILPPTRYWIGNSGDWQDTAHWSVTSNGTGGAPIPTESDDVYFNQYSFTLTSQIVTTTSSMACKSMTWTGATNSPTFDMNSWLTAHGSIIFITDMTITNTTYSTTYLYANTASTLTTAGHNIYSLNKQGTNTLTLQDILNVEDDLSVNQGTFDTNGNTVNMRALSVNMGAYLYLRNSTININSGSYSNYISINATSYIYCGTSKINFGGTVTKDNSIGLAGTTLYDVEITGLGCVFASNGIYNSLKFNQSQTIVMTSGTTQTVSSLIGDGTTGTTLSIKSSTAGTPAMIVDTSGTNTLSMVDIQDIAVSGGAIFYALDSNNISGNSGWTWTMPPPNSSSFLMFF